MSSTCVGRLRQPTPALLAARGFACTLDARGLLVRKRRGASERVVLVGLRLAKAVAASPFNSVAPNEKETSGTQGTSPVTLARTLEYFAFFVAFFPTDLRAKESLLAVQSHWLEI